MGDRGTFLRRMTEILAAPTGAEPVALRLCRSVVDVVEADGGSIALRVGTAGGRSDRSVLCASDADARRFEDIQDLVREGPGYDVLSTTTALRVDDLDDVARHAMRWPRLVAALAAEETSYAALDVMPIRVAGRGTVGTLAVHRTAGTDRDVSTVDLQFFADAVGAVVVEEVHRPDPGSWADSDVVAQATGMIVVQLGIDPADAATVLRARAFADRTTVVDISRRVVDRTLHFRDDGELR